MTRVAGGAGSVAAIPLHSDKEAERAGDILEIALDQREVVVGDVGSGGLLEPRFEGGHALGESVGTHETGIALHAVRDAVTVLAVTGAGKFGERNGEVAEESPDQRANIVFAQNGGELG